MYKHFNSYEEAFSAGIDQLSAAHGAQQEDNLLDAGIAFKHSAHAFTEAMLMAILGERDADYKKAEVHMGAACYGLQELVKKSKSLSHN